MKQGTVRAGQAIALLLAGDCTLLLTLGGSRALLCALPCALAAGAVLLLPLGTLLARGSSFYAPKWLQRAINAPLAVYLLTESACAAAALGNFSARTELSVDRTHALLPLVLLAALYGAWLGLESAARTAGLLIVPLAAGLCVIVLLLRGELRVQNILPAPLVPQSEVMDALRVFWSTLGSSGALLLAFRPYIQQYRARHTACWLLAEGGATALIAFAVCAVLGEGNALLSLPFYTASLTASPEVALRPEGIFTAMMTVGVYMRCTAFLLGFALCIKSLCPAQLQRAALPVGAGAALVLALFLRTSPEAVTLANALRWVPAVLFCVICPLLLLCQRGARS